MIAERGAPLDIAARAASPCWTGSSATGHEHCSSSRARRPRTWSASASACPARWSTPPGARSTRRSCPAGTGTTCRVTSQPRLGVPRPRGQRRQHHGPGRARHHLPRGRAPRVRQGRHRDRRRDHQRWPAAPRRPGRGRRPRPRRRAPRRRGRSARCGNVGCLEAIASGPAIVRALRSSGIDASGSADLVALVRSGDVAAAQAVRQAGRDLGEVLATCVSMLNPSVIVIGGILAQASESLLAGVREVVYGRSLPLATGDLQIVAGPHRRPCRRHRRLDHGDPARAVARAGGAPAGGGLGARGDPPSAEDTSGLPEDFEDCGATEAAPLRGSPGHRLRAPARRELRPDPLERLRHVVEERCVGSGGASVSPRSSSSRCRSPMSAHPAPRQRRPGRELAGRRRPVHPQPVTGRKRGRPSRPGRLQLATSGPGVQHGQCRGGAPHSSSETQRRER